MDDPWSQFPDVVAENVRRQPAPRQQPGPIPAPQPTQPAPVVAPVQPEADPWAQFHDASPAMRQVPDQPQQPAPSAPKTAPASEPASLEDVLKSAGVGVAQGVMGIGTLPGNLEALGRAGIDKAATSLGYDDPQLSKNNVFPTYNEAKTTIEKRTGPFYEPKSTAGKYARTIGEFAPLAAIPAGAAGLTGRVANVVAPALASETAGQLTEGTWAEPWARAAGGLVGGMLPNAAMRAVTPITNDAVRAGQVATLRNEGVNSLTAGQQTGNRALRWAESAANDLPFNGGRGVAMNERAGEQFTRAALQRAGVQADRATPEVVDGAFRNLGQQFDDLAARNTMRMDQPFADDITAAVRDYHGLVPANLRSPVIRETLDTLRDVAQRNSGNINGEAYQAIRSRLDRMRRSTQQSDPQLSTALGDLRAAFDSAMERSAPAADQAQWRTIRGQYRNLLTIEKAMGGAGENTALGLISPSQLRTAAKTQNKRAYARGTDDLGPLARAGEAIMKPLPNSGTAARAAAGSVLSTVGAATGGAFGSVPGAVIGAAAPAVMNGLVARTLMSRPVQNYFANQALAPAMQSYIPANALFRLPQAASDADQPPTPLRGGMGPRYDERGNLRR